MKLLLPVLSLLTLVSANAEKVIFTAPAPVPIPLTKPTISDLNLDVLGLDACSTRMNLSREFPAEPRGSGSGKATWVLLDGLDAGQRYELRLCWSALQPTGFSLDVYELDTVWDTPELIQSLSEYAYSRQAVFSGNDEGPQVHQQTSGEEQERTASVLFLQVRASADYFTDNAALMEDPPPVLVDLILDPYLYNVIPRSLVPTIGYIVLVAIVTWFVARAVASKLQSITITPESTVKKQT
ncbi:Fc.00g017160.m01.CDS01 [Cosmosporella sp. VM-42]